MFSHAPVILFTIGLIATRSVLILVMARSVRILLECSLAVLNYFFLLNASKQNFSKHKSTLSDLLEKKLEFLEVPAG